MCTSPCQTKWQNWKESIQMILVSVCTISVYHSYFCNLQTYILMVFTGNGTPSLYVIVFLLLLALCLSCKLYHVFCFTKNMYRRFVFQENYCMFIMVLTVCMACCTFQEMQFWTCLPLYWLLEFIISQWVASTHHLAFLALGLKILIIFPTRD